MVFLTYVLTRLICLVTYLFTYLLLTSWSRFLLEKPTGSQSRNSAHFVEPEGSLPHSQEPTLPILSRINPVHAPTCHLLKIHLNIILLYTLGSSKWSLSFRFPHQNLVCTSAVPHTCYMPRPYHSSRFGHKNNIRWGVQIYRLLIM